MSGVLSLLFAVGCSTLGWPAWLKAAETEDAQVEIIDGDVHWWGGSWKNGTWEGGTWEGGSWKGGTWEAGTGRPLRAYDCYVCESVMFAFRGYGSLD